MKQITELYFDFYDNVIKIVNAYQCFDQPYQNFESRWN